MHTKDNFEIVSVDCTAGTVTIKVWPFLEVYDGKPGYMCKGDDTRLSDKSLAEQDGVFASF